MTDPLSFSFVARNGPEFESRIRQNELGNPKFNFLSFGDPYHAYYQHKVKEFREGKGQEPVAPSAVALPKASTLAIQSKQQEFLSKVSEQPFVPKDPPAEFEFIADPPSISALDLDIVKLTAQFVARNGKQFLTNLMNREQRNFQFDFLRPQHSLFQYFTKLLEQYTKILIPPKDIMFRLKDECVSMYTILDQVKYRADWLKYEEAQKRMEKLAFEKERVAYAQIDWHDFVVVETVDYLNGEVGNFPPPTTPEEVGARVLMQERIEEGGPEENEMQIGSDAEGEEGEDDEEEADSSEEEDDEDEELDDMRASKEDDKEKEAKDNIQVQDMEEESSSEEDDDDEDDRIKMAEVPDAPPPPAISGGDVKKVPFPSQPPLPPVPDKVIVKKGYDPKQAVNKLAKSLGMDEFLISPINGERIPASKVQEHMRIGLLDPRWVEQRDKHIQDKLNQETVYAPGSAIEASLKQLAERRTDIFGVGDEETAIGKKIGEEDKKKEDKVTWDGHTSSVEAATRAARANITLEEQIHQIHKVKGLLPDEEKEKIGPKPVTSSASTINITIPPAPPKPVVIPPPKPPVAPPPPVPAPALPPQPPLPLAPLPPPPPGLLPPQPPMMMVPAPLPPIRPPPMMVPPRPPFPVVPNPPMPPGNFMAAAAPLPPQPPQPPQPPSVSIIPVSFKVSVPNMSDKPEWKLNGQVLSMVLPLQDTVSVIKAKIHESTGMPPGKQKLHLDGLFFKDSNSLAYYNITVGTVIQLQLKERGGRKK
ncbi:hypothetical protein LSTR_LSTR003285 [Laodelphax striatellus]|uniref:Splicing factor 3A subunit 1 n=1 Tax=Laodelphax striatellus TaxID=195883 RepID=A0A482XRX6_LAOST|nr:hypothetical protein LSTR_LSTR003285 [Laodelphax striatellus]